MKDSFILYNSFYDPLKLLTDEQLGRLFRAIFEFNINGSEEVSNDIKMAFAFIKNQLIVDSKKYENTLKRKSEAGKRGMKSRWSNSKENITEITNDNSVINDITKIKLQIIRRFARTDRSSVNQTYKYYHFIVFNKSKKLLKVRNVAIDDINRIVDKVKPYNIKIYHGKPTYVL